MMYHEKSEQELRKKIVNNKSCAEGEREFGECSIAFTGDRSRDTWPIGRKENKECSLGKVA